jgi:cytochrome c oxidase assembly protein subunit 15
MVFAMAVIGAITRLTESGLSITEWKPISGALPPLNEAAWLHQFELYKNSPEFAAKHFWMELSDFKKIFFWEWLHRLWGRSIGLVYALPLLWFVVRRRLPKGSGWKFAALLALGGLQGFIGWFMVQSGLIDRPSVSHFRLALHLGMALVLFAALIWLALDLRNGAPVHPKPLPRCAAWGWGVLALISTTIIWGAFVAGLDAGLIYNEFPKMGAGLVPTDFGNPLTSAAGVQFVHRWLAVGTMLAVLGYAWLMRGSSKLVPALAAMVLVQVGLGFGTLLTQVNLHLAASHQAGAIILLGLMMALLQEQHVIKRTLKS